MLGVDRATCQRIVQAAARQEADAHTLVALPGVMGLRLFLDAMEGRELGALGVERLAGARAAVDRFDGLLDGLHVSQRGLRALLASPVGPGHEDGRCPGDDPGQRATLYRTAAGIVGRWSAADIHASIIRPGQADSSTTDWVRLRALVGHSWREPSMPLELGGTASLQDKEQSPPFRTLDGRPASGASPGTLVSDFCTTPLPRVVTRVSGSRAVNVIDTEGRRGPADIVTAVRAGKPDPHPATLSPPIGEVWSLQNIPAAKLVFDVFLHLDLARRCMPSLEMHLWMPDVSRHAAARWSTRLPGGPRLTLLGAGLGHIETPGYARYGSLVHEVLDRLGWSASEFVGFRCEVEYPIWRAGYCMLFDFSTHGAEERE
ncbi:MAG: hypothetical protein DYG92_03085 [Leptolyngbya sp. PLA1]|nr:hypothetical protein [Leptolyngbya sp. PLA1]